MAETTDRTDRAAPEGVPAAWAETYLYDWTDLGNPELPCAVLRDGGATRIGHRARPERPVLVVDLDYLRRAGVAEAAVARLRARFAAEYPYED